MIVTCSSCQSQWVVDDAQHNTYVDCPTCQSLIEAVPSQTPHQTVQMPPPGRQDQIQQFAPPQTGRRKKTLVPVVIFNSFATLSFFGSLASFFLGRFDYWILFVGLITGLFWAAIASITRTALTFFHQNTPKI